MRHVDLSTFVDKYDYVCRHVKVEMQDSARPPGPLSSPPMPTRRRSAAAFRRACRVLPGGVDSPVRAFKAVGGTPVFLAWGSGARVGDIDGNAYTDFMGSWGPLILGHADPAVVRAVARRAASGLTFGACTELETALAEAVRAAFPSCERVRLVTSGTEAAMSAVRLARAATRREGLVKFAGCYHGHADSMLVSAGSGALTFGHPSSPGVPKALAALTAVLPYNDLEAVERFMRRNGPKVAAVLVEPVAGNMGVVAPAPGFLKGLRRLCDRHGALLVFDEVITGFRVARGGAQALYGIRPDLTVLGKILGGGMPAAAYGGAARLMKRLAPEGPVYQAGTLSGNPLAMTAGLATLQRLDDNLYVRLDKLGARLEVGLSALGVRVNRVGSMLTPFFCEGPVTDLDSALKADTRAYGRFFRGLLDRGVMVPPAQFEAWFVSAAHTEAMVDRAVDAAREALDSTPPFRRMRA